MASGSKGTIFWDFDGTLIHTRAMWREAFVAAIRSHAPTRTDITIETIFPHIQKGFPWQKPETPHLELNDPLVWWSMLEEKFQSVFIDLGFSAEDAPQLARSTHAWVVRPEVYRPYPDAVEVLTRLSAQGWRHVILSNHAPELPEIIEAIGLGGHFEAMIVSALVGYEKPHPEIFALAKAAADGGRLWMVGDNLVADIEGAERAGIPAILVHQPKSTHHRQAEDLRQVAAIIEAGEEGTA